VEVAGLTVNGSAVEDCQGDQRRGPEICGGRRRVTSWRAAWNRVTPRPYVMQTRCRVDRGKSRACTHFDAGLAGPHVNPAGCGDSYPYSMGETAERRRGLRGHVSPAKNRRLRRSGPHPHAAKKPSKQRAGRRKNRTRPLTLRNGCFRITFPAPLRGKGEAQRFVDSRRTSPSRGDPRSAGIASPTHRLAFRRRWHGDLPAMHPGIKTGLRLPAPRSRRGRQGPVRSVQPSQTPWPGVPRGLATRPVLPAADPRDGHSRPIPSTPEVAPARAGLAVRRTLGLFARAQRVVRVPIRSLCHPRRWPGPPGASTLTLAAHTQLGHTLGMSGRTEWTRCLVPTRTVCRRPLRPLADPNVHRRGPPGDSQSQSYGERVWTIVFQATKRLLSNELPSS